MRLNSEFHTSNDLLNRINAIWQRSQLDNMHGCIASDCPHRERLPYTGDGQIAAAMVMLNFDAAAFYQKWLGDMRDSQNPESGYVPNGAPWQPTCGGGVAWGAAMNVIPWEYYLQYGDLRQLHAGSTVLDFAFEIHSNLGLRCTGARVNGKMCSIREKLHTGDVVEIISSKNQKPTADWLNFLFFDLVWEQDFVFTRILPVPSGILLQ